jgi:ATP-grasp domain
LGSRQPSVLIAAAKWWPLSARLASAFARHGCRVNALCPSGHPLSQVEEIGRVAPYVGVRSLSCLARALETMRPDVIVPCDDGVVAQLHALHAEEPSLRDLIERSLGDPQSFSIVESRFELLATAQALGIPVPETRRVLGAPDLASWHEHIARSGVLKIAGECGGNGVRVCASLEESLAAWRELKEPPSLATACKRLTIDRDPLALWSRTARPREITMQRVIQGRPANTMLACRNGEVLSHLSVVVLAAEGATGAATIVQRIRDERMEHAANVLAARLQLSGFYGLDFMIEADTGVPHLIEMNPRCTQLGHLEFADQCSLASTFSADLRGELPPPADRPLPLDIIALYPQALATLHTESCDRDSCYLDVPWEEPKLVEELRLHPWPERRWPARLYHTLSPVNRPRSVDFGRYAIDDGRAAGIGARVASVTSLMSRRKSTKNF